LKIRSPASWLTQLVEVTKDVTEAAAEQKLGPERSDAPLPPRSEAIKAHTELAPAEALDGKEVARLIDGTKKSGGLVRSLAAYGNLDLPANRKMIREQLQQKGLTMADVLAESPPADYLARRSVALAFAENASGKELLSMLDALGKQKVGADVTEADRTTMLRLVFFPRADQKLTERLIAALYTLGFSPPDIHEYRAEAA
jgi:hypothetical protein